VRPTETMPEGAVVLWVEVIVKPEHREEFLDALWQDANGALDNEPGCLRFDVTVDTENPNRFMLFEVYRDAEARRTHRAAPYLQPVSAGLDRWVTEPSELTVARFVGPS
jgi:autoinducer 2-degrading protein